MSSTTKHGMTYVCPHCGHQVRTLIPEPDHWPELLTDKLDPAYRCLCERCKRFAVPAAYLQKYGKSDRIYGHFSNCPNAYNCHLAGFYDADCEHGQVMQKCFASLHNSLDLLLKHVFDSQGLGHNHPGAPKK